MEATLVDLAYTVSFVSQTMSKPNVMHWKAVKIIMQYLKGTLDFKLYFDSKYVVMRGYCHAD